MGALGLAALGAAVPVSALAASDGPQLAKTFVEIVNSRNFDRLAEVFGPVYKQHQDGIADGVPAAVTFFKTQTPPDLKLELVRTIVEGTYVAAIFHITGTVQGKPIDSINVDAWRIENGKFVEHWG